MKITDKITITNEDNMQLMARYPDNYFDLAIVDPPYKNEVNGLKVGFKRDFNYETLKNAPNKNYVNELFRVSKNQIMWGFNYYLELLPNTDSVICWFKHQNGHFSECEYAWSSIKKSRLFDRSYQQDQYNKIHPTQKPVELYKWILDKYAKIKCNHKHSEAERYLCTDCRNSNVKILDTHLGSGSIAIACHDYGFELTACELDAEYYEKAVQRIKNHTNQQKLF
jgi:site-specific DNA-methyltransferase (adenine-specific)